VSHRLLVVSSAWAWALGGAVSAGEVSPETRASRPASTWSGPSFRAFSGVCQGNPSGPLWQDALSWDRWDLPWSSCEPAQHKWDRSYLVNRGKKVRAYRARNAHLLPTLDYNASWSWDRSERTYSCGPWRDTTNGDTRWQVRPREDGKFEVTVFKRDAKGDWKQDKQSTSDGGGFWPLAAEHVQDWEAYVRRVVTFLRRSRYKVEYFQIWNEAHPLSGFWAGDMDVYMQRVHLPAAKIIRELGGKVVYGGWPCCGTLGEFVSLLDKHKAWDGIDVLDVHYFPLSSWQYLYDAARERGYRDKAIWQTEIAFTDDPGFVGNSYPRFLHWALTHDWNRPDKYKLFFFAYWSPDDPKAYGYHRTYYSGKELSHHGVSVQTLGDLLAGRGLRVYGPVVSSPPLKAEIDERLSSLEAFSVKNRTVVAVHLSENNTASILTDWNDSLDSMHLNHGEPGITLTLPRITPAQVAKIERCDIANQRLDLTEAARPGTNGQGLTVPVPIRDVAESPARDWNKKASKARTFYVVFRLRAGDSPGRRGT